MGISDEIKSGIYTGIGFMLKGKEKCELEISMKKKASYI